MNQRVESTEPEVSAGKDVTESSKARATGSATSEAPSSEGAKATETAKEPGDHHWRQLAVACLALLALVNGALAAYAFYSLASLRNNIDESLWRSEHRYQSLDSQIDFDSRRRHLLLGLRDEILETNPSLDWAEAYRYAALAVSAAEKYAAVDPVLLVAIGIVESGYDTRHQSIAGARGLYQTFPSTARLLARSLGWEYTDEMLFDPARSTELASLYLEMLFAAHGDAQVVLTEYKDGALAAGYLRAEVRELDRETEQYLSEVMERYQQMVSEYGTLRGIGQATSLEPSLPIPEAEARSVSTASRATAQ